MYYVYQDHLTGSAYVTLGKQDYDDLYCETCGDSDRVLETFESEDEAEKYADEFNRGELE